MEARFRLIVSLALATFVFAAVSPMTPAYQVSLTIETSYEGSNAFAHIEALCSFGPRVAGGPAEKLSLIHI